MTFQPTPPRGRRRCACGTASATQSFNPRLRAGGDARQRQFLRRVARFNPRLRAGGDPEPLRPGLP